MPQIQMDDIIILPNGGQMDGPKAWGTIIQTAKRSPPIAVLSLVLSDSLSLPLSPPLSGSGSDSVPVSVCPSL